MKLYARVMKGKTVIAEEESVISGEGRFHRQLELAFIDVCKKTGVQVPMWLSKNTREFSRFKWTSFNADQFFEPVVFDRLEIRLEE